MVLTRHDNQKQRALTVYFFFFFFFLDSFCHYTRLI